MSEIEPKPPVTVIPELKREVLNGHDRLTVVLKVHYEHKGEKPISVDCSFSDLCKDGEETYTRRFKVGGYDVGWKPLDLSYLQGKAGYILIQNIEGANPPSVPSSQENAELAKRVIRVAVYHVDPGPAHPTLDIPPGRFLLLRTTADIHVRCDSDLTAQCRIHVFPA